MKRRGRERPARTMPKEHINVTEYTIARSTLASGGSLYIATLEAEDSQKGNLVFFIEIQTSDKDNDRIIALLERELEKQYFYAPTESVEFSFENALAKANMAVKDILLSKPKNWLTKIHVLALALSDEEVHLSSVGAVTAFLTHQERIVDILTGANDAAPLPNPVKLFSNIVSGRLIPGDAITITNEAVLDYLSVERIRKITQEHDPRVALEKLFELLSQAPASKQFGLAVSKRVMRKSEATEPEPTKQKTSVLDEYFEPHDEEDNATFVHESGRNALATAGELARSWGSLLVAGILRGASATLEWLEQSAGVLLPKLARLGGLIAGLWRNRKARDYHLSHLKTAFKKRATAIPHSFKQLPRGRKTIALVVIGLALVFVASVSIRARQQASETAEQSYQALVSEIEIKRDQAQATLIYQEETRAREIISEALGLLAQLPQKNSEQEARHVALKNELDTLLDRSQKKKPLKDLVALATVIPAPLSPNQAGLLSLGEQVFFYDGVGERISLLNTKQGLLLTLPLENQGMESFNTAIALQGSLIAAINQETVLFVDTARETVRKERFSFDPATVTPFASYARNLYTVSKTQNEIIRYREAGRGFTGAQEWLSEDYTLSGMVDIAVDGAIYTLHENGDIHVFLNGAPSAVLPFPLPDDPPGVGVSFYTNENIDTIYILDPAKKRILKMSKQGELEIQLLAEEFASASDMATSNEKTELYVLAGDKIYRIPVTQ